MSKYLNHSESIASYLDGQMSPEQMQEFEKQLHTDPVLRSEFELQNDIIHTLKDFRKAQLKTRLDQVPVGAGPSMVVGVKAAAALVISGIVGIGAYLYFTGPDEETGSITENIAPVELKVQPEEMVKLPEELPVEELVEEPVETVPNQEVVSVELPTTEPQEIIDTPQEKTDPVINSPRLADPNLDHTEIDESIEIPTAALAQERLADNHVVAVETAKKDSDMFHYQYYSGKLYLYGDFRDNPYEILELNSANGKRLFIYYNHTYYKIADNQLEITPLEELTDQGIIKKLEIIQANK